jgi:hypothetical protein
VKSFQNENFVVLERLIFILKKRIKWIKNRKVAKTSQKDELNLTLKFSALAELNLFFAFFLPKVLALNQKISIFAPV